eukprot:CAMPEP_0202457786 /NCGR_PEP_ID=MMETSP1360-20130828/14702_1 /ASSEMBLY_ACC=CAM_ASM_000848 /TAXON_ID=515479 /ORGANISM="Licmophora paradoxa, Strain CCMP2313" /LENGTH=1088 /DNA_ID=CAMNT_0049077949 /DNA_START=115 /DNA_END=3381 /DNA_ORIENTATION=+
MSSPNGSGSLRPTWARGSGSAGRGFQPPPAVPERRSRSGSHSSGGSDSKPSGNKFSVLDDDNEITKEETPLKSRTAFRSRSFGQHSPPSGGTKGRSLADLAARVPESTSRMNFSRLMSDGVNGAGPGATLGATTGGGGSGVNIRFSKLRSNSESENERKVIRFTREKLLALRPRPDTTTSIPEKLKHLEGVPIIAKEPLDPVCWDNFDGDEIWAQAARERPTRTTSMLAPKSTAGLRELPVPPDQGRRVSSGTGAVGRWARGVALPPPDANSNRRSASRHETDDPNDLWDDPLEANEAATDFSAFGAIPDDPKDSNEPIATTTNGDANSFDFEKMTEETNRLEEELRKDSKTRSDSDAEDQDEEEDDENRISSQSVDPHRPLASIGTTIRSGSGDDVNVFEDFDDTPSESIAVKAADEDPSASSRLMKMIGVNKEETNLSKQIEGGDEAEEAKSAEDPAANSAGPSLNPWASAVDLPPKENGAVASIGASIDIPSNPWGGPIVSSSSQTAEQNSGFDLGARLAAEQKAHEELQRRQSQEAELLRRRQEEAQRRAMEEQARQQALKQQRSQVELVLMERISTILENSWGRSDLVSILTTLNNEDSRVIQLLGNVDSLRALIARHPARVAIRQDPAFGAEMAVLLLTNAQFQQQKQDAQIRAQQEEIRRRQERQQNGGVPKLVPDAPWFYSDPQQNIQGPFRAEEMRQWLEAGYFKGDLPIGQQPGGPFLPLGKYFPNLNQAFKMTANETDEIAARARAEEIARRLKEQQEEQMRLAAEARAQAESEAKAEMERRQQEAAVAAEAAEAKAAAAAKAEAAAKLQAEQRNDQSTQLKMLLGLGASSAAPEPMPTKPSPKEAAPKRSTGSGKKNPKAVAPAPVPVPPPVPAKPQAPAWGSAVSSTGPRKSMAEIQQEEARAAASTTTDRQVSGGSSGWANIAASGRGGPGWRGGAAKPTTPPVVGSNSFPANRMPQSHTGANPSAVKHQNNAMGQQPKGADDFGTNMSAALKEWCKDQMRKLNGSDDLTLVSFCMTLKDASEIRQYLNVYLGSTPQVNNFANEFITKRGLGKQQQGEWESTKPKKNRKKGGTK